MNIATTLVNIINRHYNIGTKLINIATRLVNITNYQHNIGTWISGEKTDSFQIKEYVHWHLTTFYQEVRPHTVIQNYFTMDLIQGKKWPTLANTDGMWFGPLHFSWVNVVIPTSNAFLGFPLTSWTSGPPESTFAQNKIQWALYSGSRLMWSLWGHRKTDNIYWIIITRE